MKFYQPFLPNEKSGFEIGKAYDKLQSVQNWLCGIKLPLLSIFQLFRAPLTVFYLSNIVNLTRCSFQFAKIDVRDCVRVFTKHGTSNMISIGSILP